MAKCLNLVAYSNIENITLHKLCELRFLTISDVMRKILLQESLSKIVSLKNITSNTRHFFHPHQLELSLVCQHIHKIRQIFFFQNLNYIKYFIYISNSLI